MIKKSILLVFCILSANLFSQSSTWYFGINGGLKFNANGTTSPIVGSQTNVYEGCAGLTDTSGNMLFYTDATNLWNGANNNLISGTLLGKPSSTHGALVVPMPGNNCNRYLVFTTEGIENTQFPINGVSVALVTVTGTYPSHTISYSSSVSILGNGTQFAEKLAATSDGNGGWWLVAHNYSPSTTGGNNFYAFHIENTTAFTSLNSSIAIKNALLSNANIQSVGIAHKANNGIGYNAQGQMKFNKAGNKLALALAGSRMFETFSFNKSNGNLTLDNSVVINGGGNVYGIEFSPNGNLLYVSEFYNPDPSIYRKFYQYNLSSPTLTRIIIDSIANVTYEYNALMLGPDDKIYMAGPGLNNTSLSVINNPDVVGVSCNFSKFTVPISGFSLLSLPSVISEQATCLPVSIQGENQGNASQDISIFPNPSNGNFAIKLDRKNESAFYRITDYKGQILNKGKIEEKIKEVNLSNLSAGIYFLIIHMDEKAITRKIVVQ
jgi:Secretion system C-terminal sorting domain